MSERMRFFQKISMIVALPLALGAVLVLGACCGKHGPHAHATAAASSGGCCASETSATSCEPVAAGASGDAKAPAAEPAMAQEPAPADRPPAHAAVAEQTNCPVMGGPIDKAIFVEYKGKKVYFCCKDCVEKFKADPEKYVSKLPQFAK
jgi:YHS domain-containing protein